MSFEIAGIVTKVYDLESKTASFQTREFVISTEETYPQFVKFQTTQDRCSMLEGYKEGEKVKVYFDLRGREWQGKYFTNLNAWRIERLANTTGDNATSQDSSFPPSTFPPFDSQQNANGGASFDDYNDLPF